MTTVLICDDSMFARQMTRRMLDAECHVVGEAEDGEEGVQKFMALRPEVMLVDLVMPRCGGLDAIRRIIGEVPDARILVCSAMGQEGLVQKALEAGAKGFVVKPARSEALKAALADALR